MNARAQKFAEVDRIVAAIELMLDGESCADSIAALALVLLNTLTEPDAPPRTTAMNALIQPLEHVIGEYACYVDFETAGDLVRRDA